MRPCFSHWVPLAWVGVVLAQGCSGSDATGASNDGAGDDDSSGLGFFEISPGHDASLAPSDRRLVFQPPPGSDESTSGGRPGRDQAPGAGQPSVLMDAGSIVFGGNDAGGTQDASLVDPDPPADAGIFADAGPSDDAGTGAGDAGSSTPTVEQICQSRLAECGLYSDPLIAGVDCGSCESSDDACVSNRCEPRCQTDLLDTVSDGLVAYVMSELADADISDNRLAVALEVDHYPNWLAEHWRPRTDLGEKQLTVELGAVAPVGAFSLSFRLLPDAAQSATILHSGDLSLEQDGTALVVRQGDLRVTTANDLLFADHCNHIALVDDGLVATLFVNGEDTGVDLASLGDLVLDSSLVVGRYPGKVWNLRVYDRSLSAGEVAEVGDLCGAFVPDVVSGYAHYQCGVYSCVFVRDDIIAAMDAAALVTARGNLYTTILALDNVDERNTLVGNMYPFGYLCPYYVERGARLAGHEEFREFKTTNTNPFSPSQYNLHEGFHGYQGRLDTWTQANLPARLHYTRWVLESSANWAPELHYPQLTLGVALSQYTVLPHIPLYAEGGGDYPFSSAESPLSGHMYGAGIFLTYLTHHAFGPAFMGDWFNRSPQGEPLHMLMNLAWDSGQDLRDLFVDFAARNATWDYLSPDVDRAKQEQDSLDTLLADTAGCGVGGFECDRKWVERESGKLGTSGFWRGVPDDMTPGNWGYNLIEFAVYEHNSYRVDLRIPASNPVDSEYRAMVVLYDEDAGTREYHPITPTLGGRVSVEVETKFADKLIVALAAVPVNYDNPWAAHHYDYRVTRTDKQAAP